MKTCDFGRSFVTFVTRGRGNNARIQVEARCEIADAQGATEEYFLVASCKAEDTYSKGVLFREPNYDFCAIFSKKEFMIVRVGVPYTWQNTISANSDRFDDVLFDIKMADAEELPSNQAVVKATLAGRVINGRTEIADQAGPVPTQREGVGTAPKSWNGAGRRRAMIEFPVKTMNVNDIGNLYQVDTGPILLPDFEGKKERIVERFQLAFVAYNKADEAYFVIQEPIPAVPGQPDGPKVCHYSRIVRMDAKNSLLALPC